MVANGRSALVTWWLSKDVVGVSVGFGKAPRISLFNSVWMTTISLASTAWRQSPSNLLLLIDEHVRSGGCQAVGRGGMVVGIRISAIPFRLQN